MLAIIYRKWSIKVLIIFEQLIKTINFLYDITKFIQMKQVKENILTVIKVFVY